MSESPETPQRSGTHQSGTEWLEQLELGDRPFASAVERMVRDLQDIALAAEEAAVGQLLAATARLDGETTQTDILKALLEEGRRFASRTAFFLTRPGEVRGWAARGFGGGTAALQNVQFAYQEEGVWARLAGMSGVVTLSSEDCAAVCRGLDSPPGSRGVLIPFILRGELGGALYADLLHGEGNLGVASLQLLTHSAAQTIETAPVRGVEGSATLRSEAVGVSPQRPAPGAEAAGAAIAAGAAALGVAAPVTEPPAVAVEEPAPLAEETPEVADETVMEAAEEVAEAAEEVAEAAEEVAEAAEEAAVEEAEAVDFEMVSVAETEEAAPPEAQGLRAEDFEPVEDIPAELEPEPELEDTGEIWAAEGDDEPMVAGAAAPADEVVPGPPSEVGQETVRLDVAAFERRAPIPPPPADVAEEETTEVPRRDVEPAPELPPDFELEPEEPDAELEFVGEEPVKERRAIPEASEDATIVASRADFASPPAAGYVPPAPVEETPSTEVKPPADFTPRFEAKPPPPPVKPDAAGTSQVVPPTDIQGPGSAFAGSQGIPDGEEALHEEARRLARLLVSEIKLYNEEIIEEGRRAGNIYDRLKDDIDRSRQMYEERIDPRLLEGDTDYFRQELVQRLAGGDDRLLGY